MTIKVCHNAFNKIVSNIWKGLVVSIKVFVLSLIPIGLFLAIFVVDWNMSVFGNESVSEFQNNATLKMVATTSILSGHLYIIIILFVTPWFNEEDNVFVKINKKLGLFKWREDC